MNVIWTDGHECGFSLSYFIVLFIQALHYLNQCHSSSRINGLGIRDARIISSIGKVKM
jgi:hypothetical protein